MGGLAALVAGAELQVRGASRLALSFGISPLVVGLTVVAFGTSAPEVAVSVGAVLDGRVDIAVGNVVGSCIFNILGCLVLAGIVAADGLSVAPAVLHFDIWVMLAVAFACVPVFVTGRRIARWEGALFLGYYAAYAAYLILAAQDHAMLEAYSGAMLSFVLPLTVVTLTVVLLRPARHVS